MTIKHYEDVDYSIEVPEKVYLYFVDEAKHMAFHGESGKAALRHDIERAYFRYKTFGRTPEREMEIVARTLVFEEMF